MSGEHHPRNPFGYFFHASMLVLGGAIALNFAMGLLSALIPWLVAAGVLAAVVSIVARRRGRW